MTKDFTKNRTENLRYLKKQDVELTPELLSYFLGTYCIDLREIDPEIRQVLMNFYVYGAGSAIMNLLIRLQPEI